MALKSDRAAWGWPARLIHWAMAALILFMLGLGAYTANFVSDTYERFGLVQIHKSWGFVVFSLALLRIVWRWMQPAAPELPAGTPGWQRAASTASHGALYVLMIAMPLSGWLMASASELQDMYGIKNMVFGLFAMPDPFVPGDKGLEEIFHAAHFYMALALTGIILIHAGAALKHHFVDRDAVLLRMITGARSRDGAKAGEQAAAGERPAG